MVSQEAASIRPRKAHTGICDRAKNSPSERTEVVKCAFCEEESDSQCCWPVEQFVPVDPLEVQQGDTVKIGRRWFGKTTVLELCTFHVLFENGYQPPPPNVPPLYGKARGFSRFSSSGVEIFRKVPCGNHVCFIHERDLGDGRVYCLKHWDEWRASL